MTAHVLPPATPQHLGLRIGLGIAFIVLVFILDILFQVYELRHPPYLPYDAQEIEAK